MSVALCVIAKAPVAGRVKTRLCPPCTSAQAAALADASLRDTLAAVRMSRAQRRVCVLDGEPGPWLSVGIEVIAQRGEGLADRLAAAFADIGQPMLLIGMDTPQVTARELDAGLAALDDGRCDAVLGDAVDGGYWAIGLRHADDEVFRGIPMSTDRTGAAQRARLAARGLRVTDLEVLRDVDTFADARAAAAAAPHGRFAATLDALDLAGEAAA